MEAQRYPEDYDGILAGAPANYWTRLLSVAADGHASADRESGEFHSASPKLQPLQPR